MGKQRPNTANHHIKQGDFILVYMAAIAKTTEKMEEEILDFVREKGSVTPFDIVKELDSYPLMEILRVALEMTKSGMLYACQDTKLTYRAA